MIVDTNCYVERSLLSGNVEVLSSFSLTIEESPVRDNIECQDYERNLVLNRRPLINFSSKDKWLMQVAQ